MAKIVAITGGIGCGKSIVSSIFSTLGYKVYDCDSRAKDLVETSSEIKNKIKTTFGDNIFSGTEINRKLLAEIVFSNKEKLQELNDIIHPVVKEDILKWVEKNKDDSFLFIETAILKESNIDKIIDEILFVNAPQELRIARVMNRNGISRQDVLNRINNQNVSIEGADYIINNDEKSSLLHQVLNLINRMR